MNRPRVLLADDHQILRDALAQLLASSCDVVGAVADGHALLAVAQDVQPDVIVLDLAMPLLSGLEAARHLRRTMPEVTIIVLTFSEDPDLAAEAIRAGASSYLLKNCAGSELLQAIQEAMEGRSYITPLIAKGLVDSLGRNADHGEAPALPSIRQREVLKLLADGNSMKEIASILKIKPRTVAFHKYTMMKQLGARTTADLVKVALKLGVSK